MTRIRVDRNLLVRETCAFYRGRELVIRLDTHTCDIKLKGQRWTSAYCVPWTAIYHLGAKLKAREAREAKQKTRKTRTRRWVRRGALG